MVQFGLVISDVAARETCIKVTAMQLTKAILWGGRMELAAGFKLV